jgi:hypothetical protein
MNSRPVVLFIVHPWGGGTTRFASELADLISDRVDVVWAGESKTRRCISQSADLISPSKVSTLRRGSTRRCMHSLHLSPAA